MRVGLFFSVSHDLTVWHRQSPSRLCWPLCMNNFPSACFWQSRRKSTSRARRPRCRLSAFCWPERLPQCKDPGGMCYNTWAIVPWRTHERKNIVLRGSNSSGFSQRLLGQVFIGLFDFQILFLPSFLSASVVCKLVYIHFPCFVHGRCPLKRVSQISLYSCFVGSYSVFSWTLAPAMATARKMLTVIDRIRKAGPEPHFKHLGNNGVWCDWINEIPRAVKRAHILYINLIIFAWQKWKENRGESRVWLWLLPPEEPDGRPGLQRARPGLLPRLLSIHQPWSLTSLFRKPGSQTALFSGCSTSVGFCIFPESHCFTCTKHTFQQLDLSWRPLPQPDPEKWHQHCSSDAKAQHNQLVLTLNPRWGQPGPVLSVVGSQTWFLKAWPEASGCKWENERVQVT